ncbi:uncharacterized protein LOC111083634 [Limulus polyphemus]|uniref:Uncharacterized protein LOC111083634 n=1 Tax=Limulus polyphemus TaxID=6850 RepID=A0ABM1RX73_LIMPO|nr:uncharacterized protein LOC111083634 [Limulus polyphemus]XP_022235979.1 uncharacterized protein LOC111083634 [Limulus polyphemus]XP_022235980.1 uncharacterized protein LOC111083634 [Limulus polyphemus]XP_022235981.1 uncharacterized protein LOC111083634 [Limulus polyphemus]XP_022235982.1 uncharacterized protein LOC111083634 [Limulus polyphemus]XP_022235983.1 uncharacterized protein LOC111083634 [Limulus polyphemus]XP_022235984.1 uncharacterized protein LOC111083634 [Limulus polyphemus]
MEQEFISSSAFLFRAKLLEEFPSLSAYLEKGHGEKITKISHNELHDAVSDGTAFKEGNRLVNFQSFFPHMASDSKESISSSMFKMSGLPHLREWSIWVTYSSVFQNIMVAAVFTNAVSIGIQSGK